MKKLDTKRRRAYKVLAAILLAALPAAYFYFTGLQLRRSLQGNLESVTVRATALEDSLDGVRTQLLLDAALARARAGDFEEARGLTSEFFQRVDRRSRVSGVGASNAEARMRILALRDRAITELSRQTAEGPRLLRELASLHLALADPALHGRSPLGLPSRGDTSDVVRLPADTAGGSR